MLSDCIFDLLNTTYYGLRISEVLLWIAFRLYLWPIEHNQLRICLNKTRLWIAFRLYLWPIEHNWGWLGIPWLLVVNCFQIVSLTYWTQLWKECNLRFCSCELLSDCIFDLLNTTRGRLDHLQRKLWIAFRLYLWPIEHNVFNETYTKIQVVNCFQIVSLTYWTQRVDDVGRCFNCCELLSDCIFDLLNTTWLAK